MIARFLLFLLFSTTVVFGQKQYSGIYPHLSFFNNESECGTGAVVPWAGRLWAVTYAPHSPRGSSDKLYEITLDLKLIVRPESVGGTPANRMIHRESNQLFIGPYAIDSEGKVRTIPYSKMLGRPTGNARHLTAPAKKIYYATMEEGFYEVDVETLEVTELYADNHAKREPQAGLPGYHGKGLYSGQGRLIYANNGERSAKAKTDPFTPSGVLAEWDGKDWNVILRNQFTEVSGPGGIYGSQDPEKDPVWCVGWDARSLMLMVLDGGKWHKYRLPKASHSYDGAHGWNTEWPRIREIGEEDFLMTMHGMFWRFPKTFSAENSAGISPRSSYLKVVGDFCRWKDHVVLGCDDTAKSEFLNKRKAKGHVAAPQSQSNLWFVKPEQLDHFGTILGRGAVWLNDKVKADVPSDPFLLSGFKHRAIHFSTEKETELTLEIDAKGDGNWTILKSMKSNSYQWYEIEPDLDAVWLRVRSNTDLENATAWFHYTGENIHSGSNTKFDGVAKVGDTKATGGIVRARDSNERSLHFAAKDVRGKVGYYILDVEMNLKEGTGDGWNWLQKNASVPSRKGVIEVDEASVIYIDDNGKRYRLPKNPAYTQPGPLGFGRLCREVATERDLFNCHGTFFELPANNAAGFKRVRPVTTHNLMISDYCSYRGLLILSGINPEAIGENAHIIKSDDGKTALWAGTIDDIWELGKPVGKGGPWKNALVKAGVSSDPYLMTGYDRKTLNLESKSATTVTAEIDITGMGDWKTWQSFDLEAAKPITEKFPKAFQAYWIRFKSANDAEITAQLTYE